jgi:hypothetical protein
MNFGFFKDWKSVIFGVWAAPGAPETLPNSTSVRCDTLRALIHLPSLRIGNNNSNFHLVFGRFAAELGPETRFNGSGSKDGAERSQK